MSTLSVPLTPDLLKGLEHLVQDGVASSKAHAARMAIKKYLEDRLVEEILRAKNEPTLYGDLDTLAKKFK